MNREDRYNIEEAVPSVDVFFGNFTSGLSRRVLIRASAETVELRTVFSRFVYLTLAVASAVPVGCLAYSLGKDYTKSATELIATIVSALIVYFAGLFALRVFLVRKALRQPPVLIKTASQPFVKLHGRTIPFEAIECVVLMRAEHHRTVGLNYVIESGDIVLRMILLRIRAGDRHESLPVVWNAEAARRSAARLADALCVPFREERRPGVATLKLDQYSIHDPVELTMVSWAEGTIAVNQVKEAAKLRTPTKAPPQE